MRLAAAALAAAALALAPGTARAQRPALAGEATHGAPGGAILVHYATTGADAAPVADTNGNGVSDFVEEVAATAEAAHTALVALGFRAPLSDGTLGGDGRVDFYLRNLIAADGNAGRDSCTGDRCIGFAVVENDYAGFNYPSVTEGIRSVVPHELFHLMQLAYSASQSPTWGEGTAVWAVEQLYDTGNSDFERFLAAFLTRSYRPLERPSAGFGDSYPYGAALWPYFLTHRYDVGAVVEAWRGCETAGFLDAIDTALAPRGSDLEAAFIEFTRWNLFTGPRAAGGGYPSASAWPQVPREAVLDGSARHYIEGMSARYVPLTATAEAPRVVVTAPGSIRVAAWLVRDGGGLGDGVELTARGAALDATVPPGPYTLVVTGLTRGTIATAVDVALAPPAPPEQMPGDDGGSCSAAGGAGTSSLAVLAVLGALVRRPRSRGPR